MMIFLSRWCCRFGSRSSSSNSYNVFTTSTGLRAAATTKTTTRWATSSTVTTNNAGAINNAVAAAESNKPVTVLVLDTETTGKVKFNKPYTDKEQPDLVQLGFLLVDCNNNNNNKITDNNNNNDDDCYNNSNNNNVIWKPRLKVSLLVNDDNNHVIIEKGAFETHGISTEDCQRYGVPRTIVLDLFHSACQQADILVAHNLQFDVTVMKTAWYRQQQQQLTSEDHKGPDKQPPELLEKLLLPRKSICTMQASTDILRLPSPYKKKTYKWPTLQEAYSHFANTAENDNNNEIKDAHDALGDAQACLTIFRGLVETGAIQITDDKDYDDDHDEQRKSNDDNKSLHHHELSASTSSPSSSIAKTAANITSIDEEKPTTTTTNLAPRKNLTIELEQHGFYVSGSTYQYKDDLKNLGAKWNPKMKAWNFKDHYQLEAVMEFIGIPITNGGGSADEHMVHYYLKHEIDINDNN